MPCWVDVTAADPERALPFYSQMFGWEFDPEPEGGQLDGHVARDRGRAVAGVQLARSAPGLPPSWTTYVAVKSVDRALERAFAVGGSLIRGPGHCASTERWAVLADPLGAVIGVREVGVRIANVVNEAGAWALSMLHAHDVDRAAAFYAAVFGWRHEPVAIGDGEMVTCRLDGYVGGIPEQPVPRDVVAILAPTKEISRPYWRVRFWLDDIDAAAVSAVSLGGQVLTAPHDVPGGRTADLADPSGAPFTVDTPAGS